MSQARVALSVRHFTRVRSASYGGSRIFHSTPRLHVHAAPYDPFPVPAGQQPLGVNNHDHAHANEVQFSKSWSRSSGAPQDDRSRRIPDRLQKHLALIAFSDFSEQNTGVRDVVRAALNKAYPEVQRPTRIQSAFLPIFAQGGSLMIRGAPSSGKSFGLALAVLSQARQTKYDRAARPTPTTTTIVLASSNDLALQYEKWFTKILDASDHKFGHISKILQVLYRGPEDVVAAQDEKLKNFQNPHIMIATPQRLLDILANKDMKHLIDIHGFRTLVVDEADVMLDASHGQRLRQMKYQKKHSPAAEVLLSYIIKERRMRNTRLKGKGNHGLQLVFASATANARFRQFLIVESKYIDQDQRLHVVGYQPPGRPEFLPDLALSSKIKHHVLGFDGPTGENGEPTLRVVELPSVDLKEILMIEKMRKASPKEFEDEMDDDELKLKELNDAARIQYVAALQQLLTRLPNPVKKGLVIIDHEQSIKKFVAACQEAGLTHVKPLRLPSPEDDGPSIYVSQPIACRGLNVDDVAHVFVLMPYGSASDYTHMAGRTGRKGTDGDVYTVLIPKPYEDGVDTEQVLEVANAFTKLNIRHLANPAPEESTDKTNEPVGPEEIAEIRAMNTEQIIERAREKFSEPVSEEVREQVKALTPEEIREKTTAKYEPASEKEKVSEEVKEHVSEAAREQALEQASEQVSEGGASPPSPVAESQVEGNSNAAKEEKRAESAKDSSEKADVDQVEQPGQKKDAA
ncbi:hypothetical protein YB2330_000170 [Saitoella coloradoensis]